MALQRGRLALGAALLAAVALVAGCASSGGGASSSSAAGDSHSAASTGAVRTGTSDSTAAPKDLEPFNVLLDWFPNPDHISLFTAQHAGYYKDEGLNVTLQSPSNSTDALKLISLGQVDLAISYEPQIITASALGLDVEAVGALIPNSLTSIILSGKQGITSLKDLEGKKLGSTGDPITDKIFAAVLSNNGVDPSKVDVISLDTSLVPAIVSGQVAGIDGAYPNIEGIQLRDEGIEPVIFTAGKSGVAQSDELVMIARKSKLASDPAYRDRVKRFLAALSRGDADAQAHPDDALTAITPVAKGYDAAQLAQMVDATIPFLKNPAGPFGMVDTNLWQNFADWMFSEKLITKKVDVKNVLDMSLLPAQ